MSRKILITGSTGFIGKTLVGHLSQQSYSVFCAVRSKNKNCKSDTYVIGNISSDTDWQKPLKGINTVVHLAGRAHVFDGNARDAVKKYPMNINVAASLALAGIGFDKTKVKIVADPVVTRINHKILAHGKFGRLRAEVENMPNPNNPKSSYMASLSAIATLKRIINPIQIGA